MKLKRPFLVDALHLFVLGGFAIAQPVYDVLGRSPEFFVAHRSRPADIILLVLFLSIVLPAFLVLVEILLELASERTRRLAHWSAVACLVAAVALQALQRLATFPGRWMLAGAGLLGALFAVGYFRFASLRSYLTFLTPAILIFPGLFLFHSPVIHLILLETHDVEALPQVNVRTPIVMVVFDELPLTSLMDEHREIDAIRYPNFAALARDATWFRNATTVAEFTDYVLPSLVTGKYPRHGQLPTAVDHPHSIFTLFGGSYRLQVLEAYTGLCPPTLCQDLEDVFAKRMLSLLADVSIVYAHILLPRDSSTALPPIQNRWANFTAHTSAREDSPNGSDQSPLWRARVRAWDQKDRVDQFMEFVSRIQATEQPTLYFLDVQLPHQPFMYLPSGRQYPVGHEPPGRRKGAEGDKWEADEFAAIQYYQRHLLQAGYVDTLLGVLLGRLQAQGLYDRSLIVITADHGISFRPNDLLRDISETNLQDILPVPLFIKLPHAGEGKIDDRNAETIDILPTIADTLGITLPWSTDGSSLLNPLVPERAGKSVFIKAASIRLSVSPQSLQKARDDALVRKIALFGSGEPERLFKIGPHSELVGRPVRQVPWVKEIGIKVILEEPNLFTRIDPAGGFVPAYISGLLTVPRESTSPVALAIAVNGVIQATTRTYTFQASAGAKTWSALVPEDSFRTGENDIVISVIDSADGKPLLKHAYRLARPDQYLNAKLGGEGVPGVEESGFLGQQSLGGKPVRWTDGRARLIVPIDKKDPPRALRLRLADTGPLGTRLKVLADDHRLFHGPVQLFHGPVPPGSWSQTFSLADISLHRQLTIDLLSDTFVPADIVPGSTDQRTLGVLVEAIMLLESDRPLSGAPFPKSSYRSEVRLIEPEDKNRVFRGDETVTIRVRNDGQHPWATVADLGQASGSVRVGILWFAPNQSHRLAEHGAELPHTLYPGQEIQFQIALNPVGYQSQRLPPGAYEVWIGLVQEHIAWFYQKGDRVLKLSVIVKN